MKNLIITLGVIFTIFILSAFLGTFPEKMTGIKQDHIMQMSRSNDAGTTEYVDENGLTKKEAIDSAVKSAKQNYPTTPEEELRKKEEEKWNKKNTVYGSLTKVDEKTGKFIDEPINKKENSSI